MRNSAGGPPGKKTRSRRGPLPPRTPVTLPPREPTTQTPRDPVAQTSTEPAHAVPIEPAHPAPAAPEHRPGHRPVRSSRREFGFAAAALFFFYLSLLSGHQVSIDGMLMQHEARSLVVDGTMRFRTPVWTWDGNAMSNSQYGIGQTLLYLPGYFVAAPLAPFVPSSATKPKKLGHHYYDQAYRDPLYAAGGSWIFAAITSAAAWVVALLALALGASRRAALWAMAFYGVGSTALVYARGDFSQPLIGLCWAAGLLAAVRFRDSGRPSWLWTTAGVITYGILSRPFEGLLLVPAVLIVLLPVRSADWNRRVFTTVSALSAGVLAAVAITLLVNLGRFGEMLHFGYTERARWMVPELATVAAVLVSPARGIVWQFPAVVLAASGMLALVRRGEHRAVLAAFLLVAAMLAATASWHVWWGGWCYGLRLFVPAIAPLAALAAVGVDGLDARLRRFVPGVLLAAGFTWAFPCVLVDALAGYAKAHDGAAGAWFLTGFPPYGVWQYLRRVTANALTDIYGIDVVWFRVAHLTDGWSLLVPVVLLGLAIAAAAWSRRALLAAES